MAKAVLPTRRAEQLLPAHAEQHRSADVPLNYYNLRMAGQSVTDAARTAVQIVRIYVPGFTPVQT